MANISPWAITDTFELLPLVEQIKKPASYLVDKFFPNVLISNMSNGYVSVEYVKQGRRLAPYIVKGGSGRNISRSGSKVDVYKAPLMAPRRTIGIDDIETRIIGEQPVFSTMTPADRAAKMQADDLNELLRMIQNRKNQMASEILQTGKVTVTGFADDGQTVLEDEIVFDWDGLVDASEDWSTPTADIFGDIQAVSEKIQEDAGVIPTLMVCGKNVARKIFDNQKIRDWLMIPNRENLTMASFAPRYVTEQVQYIGNLAALNLEIVCYSETFTDDNGQVKNFVDPDVAIIGVPGTGRQIFGAVAFLDAQGNWQTAAAPHVPVYRFSTDAQESSLTIFSRCLTAPAAISDWCTIRTKI